MKYIRLIIMVCITFVSVEGFAQGIITRPNKKISSKPSQQHNQTNNAIVQFETGEHYFAKQNYIEAVKWYRKAANQGYAPAQHKLSSCYLVGRGIIKDQIESAKWCRKAAEQGYAPAQLDLGACYTFGYGVNKDYYEAAKWYRKAAEQGNDAAQYSLGTCYYYGEGVNKDYNEAEKWWRKAAEQGHKIAIEALNKHY